MSDTSASTLRDRLAPHIDAAVRFDIDCAGPGEAGHAKTFGLSGVIGEIADWLRSPEVEAILVAHQRTATSGCICGWAKLGHSHPGHVAQVLAVNALDRLTDTGQETTPNG